MATKRDYYEVLGVAKDATPEQIKKAFHKQALANHPDTHPGDKEAEQRFKEATEAYEVLSDPKKRQAYDQYGFAGIDGAGGMGHDFSGVYNNPDFQDIFGGGGFEDIFSQFFGGGASRARSRGPAQGASLRYNATLDFKDALFGTKLDVSYVHNVVCDTCHGSGSSDGSGMQTCPVCHGTGQMRHSNGFFSVATTCQNCGGTGQVVQNPCKNCGGTGVMRKQTKLRVTIPAGVDNGSRITLRGMGDAGEHGGPSGDLVVFISVRPDKYFVRQGNDLYLQIPVSMTQAALGSDIMIKGIDDKEMKVTIPAGTQSGKLLRLRGQGAPKLNSTDRGDLYVKIQVDTPKLGLNLKARNLMKQLSEALGENSNPTPVSYQGMQEEE